MTAQTPPATNPLIQQLTEWRDNYRTLIGQGRLKESEDFLREANQRYPGFERLVRTDAQRPLPDFTSRTEAQARGALNNFRDTTIAESDAIRHKGAAISDTRDIDERRRIDRWKNSELFATGQRGERVEQDTNAFGTRAGILTDNTIRGAQGIADTTMPFVQMGYANQGEARGTVERLGMAAIDATRDNNRQYLEAARQLGTPTTWENVIGLGKIAALFAGMFA